MAGLAKIMLSGNVGRDPETRTTPSGQTVCSFSVAVSNKDGKGVETTAWYNCSAWAKLGEIAQQYLKKGSRPTVIGNLTIREYKANDGSNRTSLEVRVSDLDLGSRPADAPQNGDNSKAAPAAAPADDDDILPF